MDMGGEEEEEVMLKPKFLAYKEGNVYTKVRNSQRGQRVGGKRVSSDFHLVTETLQ